MERPYGSILITLALVAISALGGAWVGAKIWQPQAITHSSFHDSLFAELDLSAKQDDLMEALETLHASENETLRAGLTNANRNLANILEIDGSYSSETETAIENVHSAMLELQKATIRHLYEMRDILEPHQKVVFDRHVTKTFRENTE